MTSALTSPIPARRSPSSCARCAKSGLVTVDEDNHIHLTEEGRAIATHIYERHTILSQLLMRLGVTKETALHDACKIEHDLSDETFDAIKRHFQAHQETKR